MALRNALADERESFESDWKKIGTYIAPRSLRWIEDSPRSRGGDAYKKIIDPTATLAARTLVSGFNSGMTNQARPWQKYITNLPQFADNVAVRSYLADCEDIDRNIILQSNFYSEAAKLYESTALFGTGVMLIEEDEDKVLHCETFPIGSYYLGKSSRGRIDQFLRIYTDSARNIVKEFGKENCSDQLVRAAEDVRNASTRYEILHYIGPNDAFDPTRKFDRTAKKFRSCYMELGISGASGSTRDAQPPTYYDDKYLRESGYDEFPIMAPRWKTDGQDIWGSDYPGILAIGHVKELQQLRKLVAQGLELQIKPALQAPMSSRANQVQVLPGFTNYVDQNNGGARPLYETRPDLGGGMQYGDDIRRQIQDIFFTNLFLMIANDRRANTKAREIEELHQEKMMLLSPVLERFSEEFLDPASERIFNIVERRGLHPLPPPEFQGVPFEVEYISVLSTTLKMQGVAAKDRGLAIVGQVAAARPEALDILDVDAFVKGYLYDINFDPRAINSDEEIAAIREQRRQAAAQQQAQMQMQQGAETAKVLSDTKLEEDNALTQLLRTSSGGPR